MGTYDTPGKANKVVVVGNLAYVADLYQGLQIIDISNPNSPILKGTYNTSGAGGIAFYDASGSTHDVKIVGNYAYIADGYNGLQIIDITNPASPVLKGRYDTPSYAHSVTVVGNLAYVADELSGLQIIDITNPAAPVSKGTYDTTGAAYSVTVAGNYAYVADWESSELQVIEITKSIAPILKSTYKTSGSPWEVAVKGNYAYVAQHNGNLDIINISNPNSLTKVGSYKMADSAYGITIVNNLAYIAANNAGVQVLDISNPVTPILKGSYDTTGKAVGVSVVGNSVYVADWQSGLQILNVNPNDWSQPAPTDITLSNNSVAENLKVGSLVGTLASVNPVSSETFSYSLVNGEGDNDNNLFTIQGNQLLTNKIFDYENQKSCSIRIRTSTGKGLSYTEQFTINVTNQKEIIHRATYNTPGLDLSVKAVGNLAYVAAWDVGLQIIDISNPSAPSVISTFNTPGSARRVTGIGNYAYVADGSLGLQIIDISNPLAPTLSGSYDTSGFAHGLTVVDNYVYVADSGAGLQIIDISNPNAPFLKGTIDTFGSAREVKIVGNYAYVADENAGLAIIDISNKTTPRLVGTYNTPGSAFDLEIVGNLAYIADETAGLQIIDISNKTAPTLVGSYDTSGDTQEIAVVGDYAFLADGKLGLQIINIFNPTAPILEANYKTPNSSNSIKVVGNLVYIANDGQGLQIFDVKEFITSGPTDIILSNNAIAENQPIGTVVGSFNPDGDNVFTYSLVTGTGAEDNALFTIQGNQLKTNSIFDYEQKNSYSIRVKSTDSKGLSYEKQLTIKIDDIGGITFKGTYNTPGAAWKLKIKGNYAYVSDWQCGLQVIDISNPNNPILKANLDTSGESRGLAVVGNLVYVADGSSGLQIMDISNPLSPIQLGNYKTSGHAWDVKVVGNLAYVAAHDSGLQIIDISNPNSPFLVGSYNTSGFSVGVNIVGNVAYVADWYAGLQIFDITNPISPILKKTVSTSNNVRSIVTVDNYAYVSHWQAGLQILDITNPFSPVVKGTYYTPGTIYDIAIEGKYLYLADGLTGIQIFDISNPSTPVLKAIYDTPGEAIGVSVINNQIYVTDNQSGLQILELNPNEWSNQTPTDITLSNNSIPENQAPGTIIGTFNTTDTDLNYTFGYSLVPGVGDTDNASFTLDGNQLKTNKILDYESKTSYSIRVRTTRQGGLSYEEQFTINLTNLSDLSLKGSYDTPGHAWDVKVVGNLAYIADHTSGLQILDITNPASPTLKGTYDTPHLANEIAISDNYAYVADWDSGLQIIDITNPAAPTLKGTYKTPGAALAITVVGQIAYVGSHSSGLEILDISNKTAPVKVGTYTVSNTKAVTVVNNLAYLVNDGLGLHIVDITNPTSPVLKGTYNAPSYAKGLQVVGNYAYVVDQIFGLQIIDVTNPASPVLVGSYDTPGYANGIQVVGNLAFIADDWSGLQVIDISNKTAPTLKATYDTPYTAQSVSVVGSNAYVADAWSGLQIIDVSSVINSSQLKTVVGNNSVTTNQSVATTSGINQINVNSNDAIIFSSNTINSSNNTFTLTPNSTTTSEVTVAATTPSGDYQIDGILRGEKEKWNFSWGNRKLTYSFYSHSVFNGDYSGGQTGVEEVSEGVKNNYRKIFNWLENVINIDFVEVTESPNNYGRIRIVPSSSGYASAFGPTEDELYTVASDIYLNQTFDRLGDGNGFQESAGYHGYAALIHELGHALGINHPNAKDVLIPPEELHYDHTLMGGYGGGVAPGTFMSYDLKALQYLYGAKQYNETNTTYQFSARTDKFSVNGQTFLESPYQLKQLLWDSGGLDTFDFSNLTPNTSGYHLDLTPGGILTPQSDYNAGTYTVNGVTYYTSNYGTVIAYNVLIENVINSSSNDEIFANSAANTFKGYSPTRQTGNDIYWNTDSNDTLDLSAYYSSDVTQTKNGNDLLLKLAQNGTITVKNYYQGNPINLLLNTLPKPSLSINDVTVVEGNNGITKAIFTVSLSSPSTSLVTVDYNMADGTALAGLDYVAKPGTLTFNPGVSSQTITAYVYGDKLTEENETFFINLTNPTNATISDSQGIGIINNDNDSSKTGGLLVSPIGGIPYVDWTIVNYVDLDSSSGIIDYRGGKYTGDGHNGIDYGIAGSFAGMDKGISVNAAAAGTVIFVHDGEYDRYFGDNTGPLDKSNSIVIDHGNNIRTAYGHLKKDSITVKVGDTVVAGQPMGQVGSSGYSTGPHLHFVVYENGQPVETYLNPERWWATSVPYADDVFGSLAQGITNYVPTQAEFYNRPIDHKVFFQNEGAGQKAYFWSNLFGTDTGDNLDFYFYRPNGNLYSQIHWDATKYSFGWRMAGINLPNVPDLGEWQIDLRLNGTTLAKDSFTVVETNDSLPVITLAVNPSSVTEDGTTNLVYTFSRTGLMTNSLTVNYTVGGIAVFNSDYTSSGAASFGVGLGTVTFAPGASTATVIIDPIPDQAIETNETVALTLSSSVNYLIGTTTAVIGTINNDDNALPSITLAVNPTSVNEDGTTNLIYTFTRTGSTANALTVNFGVGGTATWNSDYTSSGAASFTSTSGTVTFAANSSTATVTIDPTSDTTIETNETVALTLSSSANYTVGTTSAVTGTILNDDVSLPNITLTVNPTSVNEDGTTNLIYTFTRTGSTANALTVNFGVGGSATFNSDYTSSGAASFTSTSGTVTFAANSSTATVTIDPTSDTTIETNETVALTLSSSANYTVGTTSAVTGTIINDDVSLPNITLTVNPTSVNEDGTTTLIYTFTRTGSTANALSVNFGVGGSATFNSDYTSSGAASFTSTSGTVTFAANSSTATLTIDPTSDTTIETNETVALTLSSSANYTVGTTSAVTGTIINDDVLPTITLAVSPTSVNEDGTTNLIYTFTRTGSTEGALSVNFGVGGSATFNNDYTSSGAASFSATTGSITFAANNNQASLTLNPTGDTTVESHETVSITLLDNTAYIKGTTAAVIATINNDDGDNNNNELIGGPGADNLDGQLGNDTMIGGDGNDTYTVDSSGDLIVENPNAGTDTVKTYLSYILGENLENLTLLGISNLNATGNNLNNSLTGNNGNNILTDSQGNDTLDGKGGDDTLIGGVGNDVYVVDSIHDVIIENTDEGIDSVNASVSYTLSANLEKLTLTGTGNINGVGNNLNNTLTGNSGNNTLIGYEGNDSLDGKGGNDTLIGGLENDVYIVDSIDDVITENSAEGTDSVNASVSYTLSANLEKLTLTGTGNLEGIGNSLDNTLTGNSGNNTLKGNEGNDSLDGKAGSDTLVGGSGNDVYTVDHINDVITENLAEGTDSVNASVSFTLGDNLENLTLTGSSNLTGTGNSSNNTLTGNTGANILSAGGGNDSVNGGNGDDTLYGGEGNNTLVGGAGNDVFEGGNGDDRLTGGAGSDSFTGGGGVNTFVINPLTDSLLANFDRIGDLKIGVDFIDGSSAVGAVSVMKLGEVTQLSEVAIASVFNSTNFVKNGAAIFTFVEGSTTRTFLALNDSTAGFSASTDAIIEITGYTGELSNLAII
ncbi:Calx-beta domain-containing protein [Gloeothece verrucosa]|uniref:Peptidase M23 n=1 Tax=Gloeothece verrucosa (strain PCC 7822) TaxID=497965 RepID=E0UKL0_GLOV7|nr:Calx-beta domain-containing protein [Gloeothece verrucosa]ADN17490.1 Peptidase M23 [Gloeothece verrucosa PCC 7822]